MIVTAEHRLDDANWAPSPHHDERPAWAAPELIVIHCVSLPEGQFGTGYPSRLFCGDLDLDLDPSFADLKGMEVAPHNWAIEKIRSPVIPFQGNESLQDRAERLKSRLRMHKENSKRRRECSLDQIDWALVNEVAKQ